MADTFTTGIQIPDLVSGQARPADSEGLFRIFSRQQQLFGIDSNGTEFPLTGNFTIVDGVGIDVSLNGTEYTVSNIDLGSAAVDEHVNLVDPHPQYTTSAEAAVAAPVQTVNGDTGEVRVSYIEAPLDSTTQANVIASDNSIAFNFNNQARAVYRIGGVDYFPNNNNPYSYRFRDADGSNFAGLRAPDVVPDDYFSMLPTALGSIGSGLTVVALNGNQQQLGYKFHVKYFDGNPTITPADFEDRNQVALMGSPAHLKVRDDEGFVRGIFNEDQNNFLYWKNGDPTQPANRIYISAVDPTTTDPNVSDGALWIQL